MKKGEFRKTWYSPEVLTFCALRNIEPAEFVEAAAHTLALANPIALEIEKEDFLDKSGVLRLSLRDGTPGSL